jgi:hypothetical protein
VHEAGAGNFTLRMLYQLATNGLKGKNYLKLAHTLKINFYLRIALRTGLVTFYVETAIYNGLLKKRYKGG